MGVIYDICNSVWFILSARKVETFITIIIFLSSCEVSVPDLV